MLLVAENVCAVIVDIRLCRRIIDRSFFLGFGVGVGVGIAAEINCSGIDGLVCFFGLCDCRIGCFDVSAFFIRAGEGRLGAAVVV